MSAFHDNALMGASGSQGYQISRSVRLRSSASAYFSRTFGTPTNNIKWTWSAWVKRGTLSGYQRLFGVGSDASGVNQGSFYIDTGNFLVFFQGSGAGATEISLSTTPLYRDPSGWYHIVLCYDSANATSSNRLLIYVNGVQVTAFQSATYPTSSLASKINVASVVHAMGVLPTSPSNYFDGYLTEINFIDGQALTPSSFGVTNAYGVWSPIKYTGTYGTNGFYLNFSDNSNNTAATIGKDYSGNGNNWTPNNISVTSGTTYDSMLDVPTLYADGGNGRGNYAVWNSLDKATVTVSNANLSAVSGADVHAIRASIGLPLSGKFYWETTVSGLGYGSSLGIANAASNLTTGSSSAETRTYQWGSWFNSFNSGVVQYGTNQAVTGGTNWSGASQLAANDILMIAVDMDNGSMWVGKNGTWFNSSGTANPATNTDPRWTGLGGTTWFAYYSSYGTASPPTANINFGQRPFTYTPPSGFVALNTQNLPDSTIKNGAAYMAATTYTGTGSTQSITNTVGSTSFQPDFVWMKSRSAATSHHLADSVRGIGSTSYLLLSNTTDAESTSTTNITAVTSTGFTVGSSTAVNNSGATYVGWQWKAGGSSSSNTSGSITSTVSVNATAGFSIVTYTGNGTAGATIGHGLGVAPSMMIAKNRSSGGSASYEWTVYHASLGATKAVFLNDTGAAATDAGYWYNTAPTSTLITVPSNSRTNVNGSNFVIYCFSAVAGYSAFGSFASNQNSDGPFIFLGFRPRWIMIKRTDTAQEWVIVDTGRSTYNQTAASLLPNSSGAEGTGNNVDVTANGFKIRTSGDGINYGVGGTYIYAAFAENPFKYSLAR